MTKAQLDETRERKIRAAFKTVPYVRLLKIELDDLRSGEAVLKLKMREELCQPQGIMHGGATASLIDTATAFAIITLLDEGEKTSTVDLTIHYMRPVSAGEITCAARVLRAGKRLLTVSADVAAEDGKPIATALSTYARIS